MTGDMYAAPMLTACAYLVNGEMLDLGVVIEASLKRLQAEGYSGRALIDALITDDWGAPPRFVEIVGKGADGKRISLRIPYD